MVIVVDADIVSSVFDPVNIILSGGQGLAGFGLRNNISTAGDDIWPGTATTIPIPADAGEQMSLVSTSAQDAPVGTGVSQVEVQYLDNNGNPATETVTMNGITAVDTNATNIRFVQYIHTMAAGSSLLAVGTITIFKKGSPATIYNEIIPNTNMSLSTARMVPAGKVLLLLNFQSSSGAAAGGKSSDVRLRVTAHPLPYIGGTPILSPRLFHFVDNGMLFNSATRHPFLMQRAIPALAIVKCTAYASSAGSDVQASWEGVLVNV